MKGTYTTSAANKPWAKQHPCDKCGKPFVMHPTLGWKATPVIVHTEEVSCMRGDDIVTLYHPECASEVKA